MAFLGFIKEHPPEFTNFELAIYMVLSPILIILGLCVLLY